MLDEGDQSLNVLIDNVGRESYTDLVRRESAESLYAFIRHCWPIIEPAMPFAPNWHIEFICRHLEAITDGVQFEDGSYYNRLLINIPPGCMKSLLVNCFWPLWEWGPREMPHMRYICASHSQDISIRDGLRMRRVVESRWYQKLWPHVKLTADQNQKTRFENTATGWRMASAAGTITGHRADRIVIDDPMSVQDAMSAQVKETTNTWFLEAVPSRLSSPEKSAILCIMQRLAEDDTSGVILDKDLGWDHIMLPMRYESARAMPTLLGYEDPREEEGQLLFPDRFPLDVVERDEKAMGPWATAGQMQQSPSPRGGGIIPRAEWRLWDSDNYPQFDYVIATLDTAYTLKEENDPSAMCIFGVWSSGEDLAQVSRNIASREDSEAIVARQMKEGHPKVMLMYAWNERLEFNDLVERVREACEKYQVDNLIIENKAAGISVAQELRRVYGSSGFGVTLHDPKNLDKVARLYSIQHLFFDGLIYAPEKTWAEQVITQCSVFPKSKHDDLVDCVSMGLGHLRKTGALIRGKEYTEALTDSILHRGKPPDPLYQC